MAELPRGTVTFLFTDIEGSTQLWERYPREMGEALARHDSLLREAVERRGGVVFKTVGDAFCVAFQTAEPAICAAVEAQIALTNTAEGSRPEPEDNSPPGPAASPQPLLRVRMALHAGEPVLRDGDYFGPAVNRVARILATAHGGQILLSATVAGLLREQMPAGITLIDHGSHRLKDLTAPEHLYQVAHPDLPAAFPPLRSLSSHPNNLPAEVTPFIGREAELAAVRGLLDGGARLVTLTGEGGIGKTRIALQAAADRVELYPGGVWWLDLAPLRDGSGVMPALARALGIVEESGVPGSRQVAERLRASRALLVLDNFEQVLDAAEEVADLLRACPQLMALVTSRAVLNLSIEHEYPVPEMSAGEAAALFIGRAQQVRAGFALDEPGRRAVEALCRKLDGIPLAVELAAAQTRLLPVAHIEKQLRQRFRLLVSPFRDVSQRQRTLRAAIDWSYDLLSPEERELFARLSVFVGGFTTEAAEAVCASEEAYFGIARLREQSLLRAQQEGDHLRFRMLETLREYGEEKLQATGAYDEVAARHARHYADLAARKGPALIGPEREEAMAALVEEADNLRAALGWLRERGSADEVAAMCVALAHFWEGRGWLREGQRALLEALERRDAIIEPRRRARLLNRAGWFAYRCGEYEPAGTLQEDGLRLARELGDAEEECSALNDLALTAQARGDSIRAYGLFEASLAIARRLGDPARQAARLGNLGLLAIQEGQHAEARAYLEEARQISERCRDTYGTAVCLCNLAELALRRDDWGEADQLSVRGLELFRKLDDRSGIAYTLANLAEAAVHHGEYVRVEEWVREALMICGETGEYRLAPTLLDLLARAREICGTPGPSAESLAAAERLREALGIARTPADQEEMRRLAASHRASLGEEAWEALCDKYHTLSPEEIIERAESRL